ncbi:MAG: hypothetical protein ABI574_11980 [Burkholderiales bacterium]
MSYSARMLPMFAAGIISGCVLFGPWSFESEYNAIIGKRFDDVFRRGSRNEFFERIVDQDKIELETNRPGGCAFVLMLRRSDSLITGWRYVSDQARIACQRNYVGPVGA